MSHHPFRASARRCFTLLAGATAAASIQAGTAAQGADTAFAAAPQTTDRIIVQYRDAREETTVNGRRALLARTLEPARLAERIGLARQAAGEAGATLRLLRQTGLGAHVLQLDRALSLAEMRRLAARMRARDATIDYAEPDRRLVPLFVPDDSRYPQQWDLFEATGGIRAPAAWDLATGSGVVVAVVDTGLLRHADLEGQTVAGYDMIANTTVAADGNGRDADASDPGDWVSAGQCGSGAPAARSSWHGTHVAGTIAAKANNADGIAGIAFNARIQPVRVLGKCFGYTSDIADGVTWAAGGSVPSVPTNATPARVINLSLGGSGSCGTTMQNAVNAARARGAVVVAAAGNSNVNVSGFTPASCAGVVAVAATNRYGGRAYYSNFGSMIALAAPGGDVTASADGGILSTVNTGLQGPVTDAYGYYQGTSMAAPHVAGVAALLLSAKPTATPDEIAAALKAGARAFPASCSGCGAGLLDARGALDALANGAGGLRVVAEQEKNNTLSTANWPQSPLVVNGSLSSTDTDFFRVDLPAGATLAAALSMAKPGTDYNLYYYNTGGRIVARSENGAGQVDSLSYVNPNPWQITLYVRVYYHSRSGGSGNYALTLRW